MFCRRGLDFENLKRVLGTKNGRAAGWTQTRGKDKGMPRVQHRSNTLFLLSLDGGLSSAEISDGVSHVTCVVRRRNRFAILKAK